jgi:hypothetical protein
VPGLTDEVSAIAELGLEYACAIKSGGLWCRIDRTSAFVPGFETGVIAISGTCVLKDGGVWCWQANLFMNIETARPAPAVMPGLESGVSALKGSCALKDGGVWCWGANNTGQLGNNSPTYSAVPVRVQFP